MISFRSDEQIKKEIDYIKYACNATQTQAIKDAIHAFYRQLQLKEDGGKSPQELLTQSGFIGSFEANEDLSTNYKEYLAQGLKNKHDSKE